MISINVVDDKVDAYMKPSEMLKHVGKAGTSHLQWPEGTCFRLYSHGTPSDTYFVTCGFNETRVISLWYNSETKKFHMSTMDKRELSTYNNHISVKHIEADVTINLTA